MGAKAFVAGPAHIFVGLGGGGAAAYFGTAERTPRRRIDPEFIPLMNDIAGGKPLDRCFMGEEGMVFADMTRWDETILAKMQSRYNPATGTRGTIAAGGLGALMAIENNTYRLWIQFPYYSKSAFTDQPAGYRFMSAFLLGPDEEEVGTAPRKIRCVWQCQQVYTVGAGNTTVATLYDHDVSGLPTVA